MTDAKEVSYGFGVKVAVLTIAILQYSMTMTTQINAFIQTYSLSLGEQFGYLYNQTDAIVYTLAMVSGLGTTFLLRRFTKKQVTLAGGLIMIFFAVLPFFTGMSGYLGVLIPRALMGLGVGIIMPFAASYAVTLFKGGSEAWMLGMRSIVGGAAGFFFQNGAMVIAVNMYPGTFPQGAFLLPLIGLIPIAIIIWKIPKETVTYSQENLSEEEKVNQKPYSSGIIYAAIALLMVGVVIGLSYFVFQAVSNFGGGKPDTNIAFMFSAVLACVFVLYLVVVFFMMIKITANKEPGEGIDTKIKSSTWIIILANLLIVGTANTMMANVGQVIGGNTMFSVDYLGGLGAQNIGNVMNTFTVSMLISGFIFKPVWCRIFNRHAYTNGIVMLALGMFILYFGVVMMQSLPLALVGAVLFGFGFQSYNAAAILRIAQSNDNKHVALSSSFFMAFNGLGQTFGPMWIPGFIMLTMGLAFSDLRLYSLSWLFAAIILTVMAIFGFIFTSKEKVYRPEAGF